MALPGNLIIFTATQEIPPHLIRPGNSSSRSHQPDTCLSYARYIQPMLLQRISVILSTPWSSNWSVSFSFPQPKRYVRLSSPMCVPHAQSSPPPWPDYVCPSVGMEQLASHWTSGVPRGGGFGGFKPPPTKFKRFSKIAPNSTRLWKLLKIAEFRTPTPPRCSEER